MITFRRDFAILALACAVAATLSLPSFAQTGEDIVDSGRAAAIHDCNVEAAKYSQAAWGVTQLTIYRVCMNQRRYQE